MVVEAGDNWGNQKKRDVRVEAAIKQWLLPLRTLHTCCSYSDVWSGQLS
jgi:hypothetical protein